MQPAILLNAVTTNSRFACYDCQVQRERELQQLVFAEEKLLESVFPRVSHHTHLVNHTCFPLSNLAYTALWKQASLTTLHAHPVTHPKELYAQLEQEFLFRNTAAFPHMHA